MRGAGPPQPSPRRQGQASFTPATPAPAGESGWDGSRRDRFGGRDDFPSSRRRAPAAPGGPAQGMRAAPASGRLRALSTRAAVSIAAAAALIGVVGTVVMGKEPGFILGFFVTVGAVIAAFGIRRGKMHVLIPLPALFLFIGAVLTGAFHDRGMDTSTTELGVNFLQWIAQVFFAMAAATILVLVITGGRWLLSRQLVSGQFPLAGGGSGRGAPGSRPGGGRPDRGRRDERDGGPSWTDIRRGAQDNRDPWGDRSAPSDDRLDMGGRRNGSERWNGRDRRGDRRDRGDRGDRDQWDSAGRPDPRDDRPRRTY